MSVKNGRKGAYGQVALAALCAAGLFSVVYLMKGFYPFGDGSIVITDLYSQYVPLLYRFYDVVAGEKNLFLDFSVSGGANLYADTINEVLNPFNYVLFLFGRDMLYQAVNVVLLLYAAAAAAAADFFLLKMWPGQKKWNMVLSLCYALSGYLVYNYQIIKWMYFPVLFPLFALALVRLFKEKKGAAYAILLGYQLVLSIQLGFMTLLFVLFGSGIYFYTCVKKEDRTALMCRLGLYTLAGVLLSGVVLAPNVLILLDSSRAGENLSYWGVMKRHGLDDLFERLFQIGHPVLLSLFLWQTVKQKKRRRGETAGKRQAGQRISFGKEAKFLILLNGFLWLTVLLEPANLLWHMGSYVCFPVRYAYMALLSEVCLIKRMTVSDEEGKREESAPGKSGKTIKSGLLCVVAVVLCLGAMFMTLQKETEIVQAFSSLAISKVPGTLVLVLAVLGVLFLAGLCALAAGKYRRQCVFVVTALCSVCLNLFFFFPKDYEVRLENEEIYGILTQQAKEPEKDILDREKEEPGFPLNAALVNKKSSLTGYFPTASRDFQNVMERLGYLVPWVATQSVGGTKISDDLLSMGALLERTAEELKLCGDTVLECQEELSVLTAGKSYLTRIAGDELKQEADGTIRVRADGRKTIYLDPGMTADCFDIRVNGELLEVPEAASAFSSHRIIEVGTFENCEVAILVAENRRMETTAFAELGLLDAEGWEQAAEEMGAAGHGALTEEELSVDPAKGTIAVKLSEAVEGQTLFLPFAALNGWKCELNGKNVDIAPVLGGFLGITTESGGNEIVLRFTPPGLTAGLWLSVLGVAGLAVGTALQSKSRRRDFGKPERILTAAVGILYRVLLAGGLAAVYVIPAAGLFGYLAGKVTGIGG
ncbi:MAG: YfhO family protein [Eubacteriales bacterium]|nr:YfhO family protein [Eubacteriales bacterium]